MAHLRFMDGTLLPIIDTMPVHLGRQHHTRLSPQVEFLDAIRHLAFPQSEQHTLGFYRQQCTVEVLSSVIKGLKVTTVGHNPTKVQRCGLPGTEDIKPGGLALPSWHPRALEGAVIS